VLDLCCRRRPSGGQFEDEVDRRLCGASAPTGSPGAGLTCRWPDDVVAHPLQVSIDIASLAPNAEMTVFPWKEPVELKARTINRARTFLKRYQTA
jgi:hypothetical protein